MRRLGLLLLVGCARMVPVPEPVVAAPEMAPRDAQLAYGRAVYAESTGDTEEAARQWAWVRRLDAANPWAWLAAARGLRRAGDLVGADRALDELESLAPAMDELAWERAMVAAGRGDADEALIAATAEIEGRWPEAMEMATDPVRMLAAWREAPIEGQACRQRVEAGVLLGAWAGAAEDQACVVEWVPTPGAFALWVELAARVCALEGPTAWLESHPVHQWGSAWATAADTLGAARCEEPTGSL